MLQESGSDLERRLAHAERQLSEALERQAAADEVLRLISSSPGKLELVFQAILANGTRICEAEFGTLNLYDGSRSKLLPTTTCRLPLWIHCTRCYDRIRVRLTLRSCRQGRSSISRTFWPQRLIGKATRL